MEHLKIEKTFVFEDFDGGMIRLTLEIPKGVPEGRENDPEACRLVTDRLMAMHRFSVDMIVALFAVIDHELFSLRPEQGHAHLRILEKHLKAATFEICGVPPPASDDNQYLLAYA